MAHRLLMSIFLLLLLQQKMFVYSYQYTKRCFMLKDSNEVVWNVTLTGKDAPNMNDKSVIMQTKDLYRPQKWKTLKNCTRDTTSIQCEIDKNVQRWRYLLRVVKLSPDKKSSEYIMRESDGGHYQTGLLCYPNHDEFSEFIQNFTTSNVTSNSIDMSWSFHKWDRDKFHLLWVKIIVLDEDKKTYSQKTSHLRDETSLFQTYHITGLKPCSRYVAQVKGHYDVFTERFVNVTFVTKCSNVGVNAENKFHDIPITEFVLISISCVVLLAALLFIIYFALQKRSTPALQSFADSHDIIEQESIGNDLQRLVRPRDAISQGNMYSGGFYRIPSHDPSGQVHIVDQAHVGMLRTVDL